MTNLVIPALPNITFFEDFMTSDEAQSYFEKLSKEIEFKSETYIFSGVTIESKRKISYHSEHAYSYSNQSYSGKPWTPTLTLLRQLIADKTGIEFNAVLCNFYEDGSVGMGWHADKEKELGLNPVIASLSFGQKRKFAFRPRRDVVNEKNPKKVCEYLLGDGSLLMMGEDTQPYFEHSLITDKSATKARMNLTFRKIVL